MKSFTNRAQNDNPEELFMKMLSNNKDSFYRIAYSYVKNEQDALDVVQESVCKGYVALKKIKETSYMKTWFTRIVMNTSINYLNKSKRVLPFEIVKEVSEKYESHDIERNLDLYDALSILKTQERSIVVLRFFEDHKLEDIAQAMDMPLNTVKTTLYRCLKKLRRHLEEENTNG